jgi:FkbM family methyltransferase
MFNRVFLRSDELSLLPERLYLARLLPYLNVDCVFDVGANNGQYAQMLRKKVGYKGRIISFEPIPAAVARIKTLAAADPLWSVEEIALALEGGIGEFSVMASDQFSSLGTPKHNENNSFTDANRPVEKILVKKESLEDAYLRLKEKYQFRSPFLKMDTQGFDVSIVKGGRSIIKEFLGLQSELAIQKLYEESVDFRDAISFYESCGFRLGQLVPNNAGYFPELIEMDCIMFNASYRP